MNNKLQHILLGSLAIGLTLAYVGYSRITDTKDSAVDTASRGLQLTTQQDINYTGSTSYQSGASGVTSTVSGGLSHESNRDAYQEATALQLAGEFVKAERIFRRILASTPDEVAAINGLGTVLFYQSRNNESRAAYLALLELDSDSVHAYLGLGAVARVDKDFEEAIRVYSRAAELQPGFPLAYYGRGVSHYKLGQYRAAAVDFQQTIRLAPASSDLAQDSTAYLEAMAESVNGQ